MIRTRSARRPRRFVLAAAALVVPLALGACASGENGAAALVGSRRVSETDVQTATEQLGTFFSGQAVDQQGVVYWLVIGPAWIDAAAKAGVGVSASDAKADLQHKVANPSDATIEVYRANAIAQLVKDDTAKKDQIKQSAQAVLAGQSITVSPRYGRFDLENFGFIGAAENWIASPSASASAAVPQPSAS